MEKVWIRTGVVVCLAWLASACGGGGGGGSGIGLDDRNLDGEIRILAFGDSITRGVGDGSQALSRPGVEVAGYPARLQTILGVGVINAGDPGEETPRGRDRLGDVLAATNPDYVILLEGINDLRDRAEFAILDNLIGMVGLVFGVGSQPILSTLTPTCCQHLQSQPEARVRNLNAQIRAFAETNQIPLIDFFAAFVPDPDMLLPPFDSGSGLLHIPEGLHPTPLGYDVMAQTASEIF